MVKKYINAVIAVLLMSMFPTIFAVLSRDGLLEYFQSIGLIGSAINLEPWKIFFFLCSVAISSVGYSLIVRFQIIKRDKIEKERTALIRTFTKTFLQMVGEIIADQNFTSTNVRIWKPKKSKWYSFRGKGKTILRIKNIDGLSNIDNTDDLFFDVTPPKPQGLVGVCYTKKDVMYDEDLQNTRNKYYLSNNQRNKTNDVRFCLCAPIFNNKDEIASIISFDSNSKIVIPKAVEDDIIIQVRVYCQTLFQTCPELFK